MYVLNLYNYEKYPGLKLLTVELHYTWVNPKLVLKPVQTGDEGDLFCERLLSIRTGCGDKRKNVILNHKHNR